MGGDSSKTSTGGPRAGTASGSKPGAAGAGDFLRSYTEGLDLEGARRLFERDAARAVRVLQRRRHGGPGESAANGEAEDRGSVLRQAKALFLGLSYSLTAPRRIVFALSLLAAILGLADISAQWNSGATRFRVDASPLFFLLSIAGLVMLLALELVDRIRVRDELEVARELQRDILPHRPPDIPGFSVAASYRTAAEIGGDYHAFLPLPDGRFALVIGDASGHGMAAGLLMAIADATLRTAADLDPSPRAVASSLNRRLCATGNRRSFLSLFYAVLDPATGRLEWILAGHPFPLLARAGGPIEELGEGSFPLGIRESPRFAQGSTMLEPGDRLLLVTDGLPEALAASGEAFGFDQIRDLLGPPSSAHGLHSRLLRRFEEHLGEEPLLDDLTVVVLERLPPLPVPAAAPLPVPVPAIRADE